MSEGKLSGESKVYESVCDCCMQTFHSSSPYLDTRDCPSCGVGELLGPWPRSIRFDKHSVGNVAFRRLAPDEVIERE